MCEIARKPTNPLCFVPCSTHPDPAQKVAEDIAAYDLWYHNLWLPHCEFINKILN